MHIQQKQTQVQYPIQSNGIPSQTQTHLQGEAMQITIRHLIKHKLVSGSNQYTFERSAVEETTGEEGGGGKSHEKERWKAKHIITCHLVKCKPVFRGEVQGATEEDGER